MNKYIENIFKRTSLQQIREFLLTGLELDEVDNRTYAKRLEKGKENIVERIENIAKDDNERDKIFSEFYDAESAYTAVYLEIGIKVGAKLLFELLCQGDSSNSTILPKI